MNTKKYTKTRIATVIAALMGTGLNVSLQAQEQDNTVQESNVEVIEVKGIRGSLIRSMDLKRESFGVVDAISAEEMGKFPDTNLAESLQRITGVTISRENGEGSQITVRGFGPSFNLITLNGRQMPGTGNSRSFNLENLASEGVSSLELNKTARADKPTGGLGATVNIITTRPLQNTGQQFSASVKGIYDTSNVKYSDVTPELSGVYSNTFVDDTIGFGFSFSRQERDFQRQEANIQGWQANVDLPSSLDPSKVIDPRALDADGNRIGNHFFPKDSNFSISDYQRERTNGQVTFQYQPSDEVTLTADYTMSEATVAQESFGWGIWNDFGGNINGYELDENGTALYFDLKGNDGSFTANQSTTQVESESIGLNVEWQIGEDWELEVDYHDSFTETDNGLDKGLGSNGQIILGSDQLVNKIYDYREGEIPHFFVNWRNGSNELAPSEIDSNFSQFIHSPGKSEIQQLQLHGKWFNSQFDIPMPQVSFGLSITEQEMSGTNAWSGLRGGPGFNPSFKAIFPDGMFIRHDTNDLLDSFAGGGANLNPNYYYTFDFAEAIIRQQAFLTEEVVGAGNVYSIDPYFDGVDSDASVLEETMSVYLQSDWEFDIQDYPAQLMVGMRYEKTEVTSRVKQKVAQQVNWVTESEWITVYEPGGDNNYLEQTGEFNIFLPMIDFSVDITDEFKTRVSWGKSMARAPLGNLAGGRVLSGSPKPGSRVGAEGNPSLLPFVSTNLDLSLEYYYAEGSFASVAFFTKDVKNFIDSRPYTTQIDGLHDILNGPRYQQAIADIEAAGGNVDPQSIYNQLIANGHANESNAISPNSDDPLIEWTITRPVNLEEKSVRGVELNIQHLFDDTGFGFGINATLVDGDIEFDPSSLAVQSPLPGLSDSANFQVFYDKEGLSVKLTYAWRSDYLLGIGQSQGSSDAPPQFVKETAHVDMSINYDVNEDFTVFVDAINLTDETEQGYGRYEEQFLFARQYGPRYTFGVRYSFN